MWRAGEACGIDPAALQGRRQGFAARFGVGEPLPQGVVVARARKQGFGPAVLQAMALQRKNPRRTPRTHRLDQRGMMRLGEGVAVVMTTFVRQDGRPVRLAEHHAERHHGRVAVGITDLIEERGDTRKHGRIARRARSPVVALDDDDRARKHGLVPERAQHPGAPGKQHQGEHQPRQQDGCDQGHEVPLA